MGCLRKCYAIAVSVLAIVALTACGPGNNSSKNNGNNGNNGGECQSNADCEGTAVCDLETNTCQGGSDNNTTNVDPNNTTNNDQNVDPNNTTNNETSNNTTGAECGNGVREGNEICDGDCPTMCDDGMECTTDELQGSADACTAQCVYTDITACTDDDGCCPMGCLPEDDNDCTAECGDGIVNANETCDPQYPGTVEEGACPVGEADCDDMNACTIDSVTGDAGMCTAMCSYETITACTDDDGCCPGACDTTTDNDCDPKVGQPCTMDGECPDTGAGPGACLTEADWQWPGGFCVGGCTTDQDCDAGSHCTGRVCVPDCTDDADCRDGYECYDFYGTGETTCAPAAGTAEPSGGACTADEDCLGSLFGASCLTDAQYPDGYCISGCQVDADCAAGSHCATLTGGGQACVPDCMDDGDCRTGYECFDWAGDIQNTCGPVANGNGEVGDACGVLQDCAGGQEGFCIAENPDWDGGYCSIAECTAGGGQCPTGSHCGFIDPTSQEGICVEDCTGNDDCRTNYACVDRDEDGTDECAPSGTGTSATGESCAGLYECSDGLDSICINEDSGWRAGYCTESCTSDADCATDAHCGAQDDVTNEGFCVRGCTDDSECRMDGYACFNWDDDADGTTECAPAGTGTGVEGDMCAGVWECDGGAGAFCIPDDEGSWPDGYCAISGCTADADCIEGHCGFIDSMTGEGVCIDTCGSDADCRDDYGCFDLDADNTTECLPEGDGNVGDPCGSFADCGGRENALCFPDSGTNPWPNGHCSLNCTDADICPAGSVCLSFSFDFAACLITCSSSADCRAGYSCEADPTMTTNETVCVPM